MKSDSTQRFLEDFVKSSTILINLVSNSAARLLPILSFPLNSEELLYYKKYFIKLIFIFKECQLTKILMKSLIFFLRIIYSRYCGIAKFFFKS